MKSKCKTQRARILRLKCFFQSKIKNQKSKTDSVPKFATPATPLSRRCSPTASAPLPIASAAELPCTLPTIATCTAQRVPATCALSLLTVCAPFPPALAATPRFPPGPHQLDDHFQFCDLLFAIRYQAVFPRAHACPPWCF